MDENYTEPQEASLEKFEKDAQSYLGTSEAKRLQAPKKTWFFQRGHGKNAVIIAAEYREAWDICNNRSEWKRRDFTLLGCSDGKKFNEVIKDAQQIASVLLPEIKSLNIRLGKFNTAQERLELEEVVDEDDPDSDPINAANVAKLKRLRKMISETRKKLSEKKDEYKKTVGEVNQRAFDAELKVAKANMKKNGPEWPSAANVETPGAEGQARNKILKLMNQD